MRIIRCDESRRDDILAILNDAIVQSTAVYDYRPRTTQAMDAWFAAKRQGDFPVLGAVSPAGELLGFAAYGPFRAWPAYKYTVEHSVYVASPHRRKGIARQLLQRLIDEAVRQDYHAMIGAIDSQNTASIRLHRDLGFTLAGTLHQVGYKFGHWLDVDFYQLLLPTPAHPTETEP